MKTLVYVDPQSAGSLAMYDYSLITGIKKHRVIYCCSTLYDAPDIDNISYHSIFSYNRKKHIFKLFSYVFSLFKLVGILRQYRPDTMHIQWWRLWFLDYIFLRIYKIFAKQIVFTAHNLVPHDSGKRMKKKCSQYYKFVDKIVVHENNAKRQLVDSFGIDEDKIFVIPHGILKLRVNDEHVNDLVVDFKKKYHIDNKIVIGALGTQGFYKGTDLIRDAYLNSSKLLNKNDVVFLIAGKGDVFNESFKMSAYKNFIVIDKYLTEDEFEAYMKLVDVLFLPYRKISQSGVLLTALEKEIPFAVTPVGGLIEPFSIARVGWVIQDSTIAAVQSCLEYISENKQEVQKYKKNKEAWSKIKKYYNWSEISAKIEAMYLY